MTKMRHFILINQLPHFLFMKKHSHNIHHSHWDPDFKPEERLAENPDHAIFKVIPTKKVKLPSKDKKGILDHLANAHAKKAPGPNPSLKVRPPRKNPIDQIALLMDRFSTKKENNTGAPKASIVDRIIRRLETFLDRKT